MRRFLLLSLAFMTFEAKSQSSLPACDTQLDTRSWTECFGTAVTSGGSKYVGEFKDGKRHGMGTYRFNVGKFKGDVYEGFFQSGLMSGRGVYTYSDGERYVGESRDNKRHGQGTFYYSDGSIYVGEWQNGLRHGRGVMTSKAGSKQDGVWDSDNFVGPQSGSDQDSVDTKLLRPSTQSADESGKSTGDAVSPPVAQAKRKCKDLGLKPGTEKFGECVLRLSR